MTFQRNAKIFRGRFDAAPLAGVFFLLLIFLLLASLVYTPGVPIELPAARNVIGTDNPTLVVAVNSGGQFFFENQIIGEHQLKSNLTAAASQSRLPLTLVVQADKNVKYDVVVRLTELAEEAGIKQALLQQRPVPDKSSR